MDDPVVVDGVWIMMWRGRQVRLIERHVEILVELVVRGETVSAGPRYEALVEAGFLVEQYGHWYAPSMVGRDFVMNGPLKRRAAMRLLG
mgnify:CR=1 FL=1